MTDVVATRRDRAALQAAAHLRTFGADPHDPEDVACVLDYLRGELALARGPVEERRARLAVIRDLAVAVRVVSERGLPR